MGTNNQDMRKREARDTGDKQSGSQDYEEPQRPKDKRQKSLNDFKKEK